MFEGPCFLLFSEWCVCFSSLLNGASLCIFTLSLSLSVCLYISLSLTIMPFCISSFLPIKLSKCYPTTSKPAPKIRAQALDLAGEVRQATALLNDRAGVLCFKMPQLMPPWLVTMVAGSSLLNQCLFLFFYFFFIQPPRSYSARVSEQPWSHGNWQEII